MRKNEITIKMSKVTHKWLSNYKKQSGATIRFTIDRAVELLKKQEANKNGK